MQWLSQLTRIHFENLETSFKTRGNFPLGGSSHLGSFAGRRLDKYCDQTACERKVLTKYLDRLWLKIKMSLSHQQTLKGKHTKSNSK